MRKTNLKMLLQKFTDLAVGKYTVYHLELSNWTRKQ